MSKLKELRKTIVVLDKCEATTKRTIKLEELKKRVDCSFMKSLLTVCFEPCVSYGITLNKKDLTDSENKYHILKENDKHYKSSIKAFKDFLDLVQKLKHRALTGNEAKVKTKLLLSKTDPKISKWFHKCLNRDLKAGIQSGTYGKYWPELVSDFGNQLASNMYNTGTKIMEWDRLEFPCIGEYKFDGINITQIFKGENYPITFGLEEQEKYSLSRSSIHYPIMNDIWNALSKHVLPDSYVVGEAYARWDVSEKDKHKSVWSKASSLIRSGMTPKGFDPSKLSPEQLKEFNNDFIFMLYEYGCNSFFSKKHDYTCKVKRKVRRKKLEKLVKKVNHHNIQLSHSEVINNIKEAKDFYKKALLLGFEGAMFKKLGDFSVQTRGKKRTDAEMKAKPEVELDGVIFGIYKGTGRNSNRAGGINVYYPKLKAVSGCNLRTDEQREAVWKYKEEYIGIQITIMAQEEPAENKSTDASRFMKVDKESFPDINELRLRTDLKRWPATKLTKYINKAKNSL